MAGLTVSLALAGASALAASLYTLKEALEDEKEEIILPDGRKISTGATVKLKDEALQKYVGKGLTKPGADHTGLVEIINLDPLSIEVSNEAQNRRFTDKYDPTDFILVTPAPKFGGEYIRIQGGFAREGVRVRMIRKQGSDNTGNGKALANPFYNSVGTVKAIKPKDKLVTVIATQIKTPETKWIQDYNASELEFVSLPPIDLKPGFPTSSGYINVGTRVSLSNDILEKAKKGESPYKTFFLASSEDYESEGVVTKLRLDKQNKKVATVKCQKKGKDIVYQDQDYYAEFLRPLRADGIPQGGVPIFGGIASNGIKVKLRDEKKDSEPSKCLSRSTFGYTGVVEEVDPDATDGLKVLVRCTGSNEGEEASDWYDPDSLELVDLPTGEGVPIFGGVATIGSLVEVTVDARGVKCLGKPNIGNIGIVMGIDPNSPNGEVLNIRCGRDQRSNSKVTNWYKPTDVKKFVKMSEEGTEIDRIRAQLDIERIKLRTAQNKKDETAEKDSKTKIAELEAKLKELEGEGQSREKNFEEYNRAKEELAKTRQLIASLEEQYQQASMETTCSADGLNIESKIKKNAQDILGAFCANPIDFSTFYKHFEVEFSEGSLGEKDVAKKNADDAVEAYNKDPDNDALKANAKRLVDLYNESKKKMVSSLTTVQKNYVDKRYKFKTAMEAVQLKWARNPVEFTDLIDAECKYTDTIKDLANRDETIRVVSDEGVPSSASNQIIVDYVVARSKFDTYLKGTPDADIRTLYDSYEAFKKAYEDVMNEVHGTSTVTEKNIQKLVKQSKDTGREVFEAEEEAEKALLSKAQTLEDEQIIDFYRQYITIEKRNDANDLQNQIKKVAIGGPGGPGAPNPGKGGPPPGGPGAPPAPPKTTPKPGKGGPPPGAPPPTAPPVAAAATGSTSGGGFVGGAISFEKADAIEKYKEISLAYAKLCRNLKKLELPPIPTSSSTTGAPATGAPATGAPAPGTAPGTGTPATGAPAPAPAPGTGAPATGAPPVARPGFPGPDETIDGVYGDTSGPYVAPAETIYSPFDFPLLDGRGDALSTDPAVPRAPPVFPPRAPVDLTARTRERRLHEARVASAFGGPADPAFGSRGRTTGRHPGFRRLDGTSAALDPEDLVEARAAYADAAGPEFDEEGRTTGRHPGFRRLDGTSAALSPPPAPSEFPVLPGSDAVPVLPESRAPMSLAESIALAEAREAALPPRSVPNPILPANMREDDVEPYRPIGSNPSGRPGFRPFSRPGERAETDPYRIALAAATPERIDPAYYPEGRSTTSVPGRRILGSRGERAEPPPPDPSEFPVLPDGDVVPVLPENTPNISVAQAFALAEARQAAQPPSSVPNPFLPPSLRRNNDPAFDTIGSNPSGRPGFRPFSRPGERAETDPYRIALAAATPERIDPVYYPEGRSTTSVPGPRILGRRGELAETPSAVGPRRLRIDRDVLAGTQLAPRTTTTAVPETLRQQRETQGLQAEIDAFLDSRIFGPTGSLQRVAWEGFPDAVKPENRDKIRLAVEEYLRTNYVRIDSTNIVSAMGRSLGYRQEYIFLFDNFITDDPSDMVDAKTANQKLDEQIKTILLQQGLRRGGRKTRRRKVKKSHRRRRTIRR